MPTPFPHRRSANLSKAPSRSGRYAASSPASWKRAPDDRAAIMTDLAWIDTALRGARPQAIGAMLRYFRDLDRAEEAFQEACLRALKHWPQNGPPRDQIGRAHV